MGLFYRQTTRNGLQHEVLNIPAIVVAGILAFILIIGGLLSFVKVDTGRVAVITQFGEVVGFEGEGLHFKLPWQTYNIVDVTQQQVVGEYSTATQDKQSINQTITAQVTVTTDSVMDLYRKFVGGHMDGIVKPVLADGVKSACAKYSLEDTIEKRDELSKEMLKTVQQGLAEYGINVESIQINNVELPQEYKDAVERQKVAERNQVTAQVERDTAAIQAETNKITAESLSDENFKQRFYDKWDGKLPTYMGGDGLDMLLPTVN